MNKIRTSSLHKRHQIFAHLLINDTPSEKKSALLHYARRCGIAHCLFIGLVEEARKHLCTLDFFFELLQAIPLKQDILKICRALRIQEESALWRMMLLQRSPPPSQQYISLMNFCLFANWYSSVVELSSWVEQDTSTTGSLRHDALMIKADALYADDDHERALKILHLQKTEDLSSEQQEECNTRLGIIHLHMTEFEKAQKIYLEQVQKYRAQTPVDERELSNALHNLSAAYRKQGDFALAYNALREAFSIRTQEYGEEDITTMLTQQNLAVVLRKTDREREAKDILLDLSRKYERILGNKHRYTITVHNNLGLVLRDLGEYEEAYTYMQRAAQSCISIFGASHSLSLTIRMQCAVILKRMERYHDAAHELREVVRHQQELLGTEHLDTLTTQYKLATTLVFLEEDHDEEIMRLFAHITEQREKQLGSVHPSTMVILSTRIEYLNMTNRYQEAIELYPSLIKAQKERFGSGHAKVLLSTYNQSKIHLKRKEAKKAITLLEETLEGEIKLYGKDSEDIAMTYWNLARAHRMNETPEQAARYRKRCWEIEVLHSSTWNIESLKTAVAYIKDLLASNNMQEAHHFQTSIYGPTNEEPSEEQQKQLSKMKELIESHGRDV